MNGWQDKRRHLLLRLQNITGLIIVGGVGYYLWINRVRLSSVLELSPANLSILAGVILLSWLFVTAQGFFLYRAADIRIGFSENFILLMAVTFGNYLPARAGTLIRAHYLKSIHGIRYARFGSIILIRTVLTFLAAGVYGFAATIWLAAIGRKFSIELLGIFTALILIPGLSFVLPVRKNSKVPPRSWLGSRWQDFSEGVHQLRTKPKVAFMVLLFLLLQYAALTARFYIAARIVGTGLTAPLAMLLAPLAALITYISFTPGSLGLRESFMGYATYGTESSFSQGMFIGTIDRAVLLVLVAIIGGSSFVRIWGKVKKKSLS